MLTQLQILEKNKAMVEAQQLAGQLRYELEKDRAEKQIVQINKELAKIKPVEVKEAEVIDAATRG
jgi:hypothetical protein